MTFQNSNSTHQSKVESRLLKRFKRQINNPNIVPVKYYFDQKNKQFIELDGFEEGEFALEIFAHVGKLRPGQKRKIATDILKLTLLDVKRKILILHPSVSEYLKGDSWISKAILKHEIEIIDGQFTKTLEKKLIETQKKQDISK